MAKALFSRYLSGDMIKNLVNEELFREKLEADINKGEVFFAIRPGYVSFYYKGSSLFTYGKNGHGFQTHEKFGFVPAVPPNTYITQDDLTQRMREIGRAHV